MVKVSVIMPSLNVQPYISECIESVVNQTLSNIQIICVDAGSTDGTLEILEEWAKKDDRIEIIHSDKKSYGYQVNLGFSAAKGEYVGIVETDDYIPENMYMRLYTVAENNQAEIVKADFSRFIGDGEQRIFHKAYIASKDRFYNKIINPQENPKLLLEAFYTWAGIYKRDFIEKNQIKHNETPGASYQDNGFYFQTLVCAQRIYLIHDNLYRLRRDNPNSSINSKEKVFCVCDEYDFIYHFLTENQERYNRFLSAFWINKFRAYFSTLKRVSQIYKLEFLKRFHEEFIYALSKGDLDLDYFTYTELSRFKRIVSDYELYFYADFFQPADWPKPTDNRERADYYLANWKAATYQAQIYCRRLNTIKDSLEYRIGSSITYLPRMLKRGLRCLHENGLRYTLNLCGQKIKKKK